MPTDKTPKTYSKSKTAKTLVGDVANETAKEEKSVKSQAVREKLILAALEEVDAVGFARFSLRHVAERCGMSCAAPYKHFKNKREIIEAILLYINNDWLRRQDVVLEEFANESLRVQLTELSLEFIRFMYENPQFRSILMIHDETFDSDYLTIKADISAKSKELIKEYSRQVGMSEQTALAKMYIVRSLIYGASLMFSNCELTYDDNSMNFVRRAVDREFDLPAFIDDSAVEAAFVRPTKK